MEIQSQSTTAGSTVIVQGNSSASVKTTGQATAAQPSSTAKIDPAQLEQAIKAIDQLVNVTQPPQLAFSIDDSTHETIVRITDASTGTLIRQIPSAEALAISKSLDKIQGLLVKQEA